MRIHPPSHTRNKSVNVHFRTLILAAAAFTAWIMSSGAVAAPHPFLNIEKFTLSRDDGFMEGWPTLVRTRTGKLLCAYNECVSHGNRDNTHITLRESTDGGATWSRKQYIGETTMRAEHWNSIRISTLRDGRVLIACDRRIGHELDPQQPHQMWLWESRDDGKTWADGRKLGIRGYCSDKVRELRDGNLLLCVSVYDPEVKKSGIYGHISRDGGTTWTPRITVAKDKRFFLIEAAVLQLSDGTLVAFMRENSGTGEDCCTAFSKDDGLTWDGVYQIKIPHCHRPSVGFLASGEILMTYRDYSGTSSSRDLYAAMFSERTALEKDRRRQAVMITQLDHDSSADPDGGYSDWVQLNDRRLLVVNYVVDDAPKAYIRGYRLTLPNQ